MKVAVAYHFFPHYRAGVLRELLRSTEHEFWLVGDNQSTDPSVKAWPVENSTRFILAPCRKFLSALLLQRGLLRIAWRRDFDAVIYLGNPYFLSTWISAALARLTGKRVLFWTHGWTRTETGIKAALRKLFYQLAHGLLLYGHSAKTAGLNNGFASANLHVIYNSLDYEAQKQARDRVDPASLSPLKQQLFGDATTPMIVCSARLTTACRFDLLLEAMARLRAENHPVNLLLIGDGPERAPLEAQAQRLGVPVKFFGACYDEDTLEAIQPGTTGDFCRRGDVADLARVIKTWTLQPELDPATRLACHRPLDRFYNPAFQCRAIGRAVSGAGADDLSWLNEARP